MPNLQGMNMIGRDEGGHLYMARMAGRSRSGQPTSSDAGILGAVVGR